MSAEKPAMRDIRPRPDAGAAEPESSSVEPDPSAGAWPEEMDDVRFYADSSLTIPGQSDPPGDCGRWGPREYCTSEGCGDLKMGPQRCQRRMCRDCWETWRGNRAAAVTRRLAGARQSGLEGEKRGTHVMVSPPDPNDPDTPESEKVKSLVDFEKAKKKAYQLAREKGIRGGAMIPHGWRIKEPEKEAYRRMVAGGRIGDIGKWQWVREHSSDWRTLTYWSPHFHIIGVGNEIGESDPENDDGWVFSRLSDMDRFRLSDPDSYKSMFRTASYLLSHGTFQPDAGGQMVRWFGELANNQFSLEAELSEGVQKAIERITEEVAGYSLDSDDGKRECDCEGCTGQLSPIWSVYDDSRGLADREWCEKLPDGQEAKLAAAAEWSMGDLVPPPGLRFPSTEPEAKEAWGSILNQAGVPVE